MDFFDKKEEAIKEEHPKGKKESPFLAKKKFGKVVNIVLPKNGGKGRIIVDVNGNGESIDYNAERHSNLKIGDNIDF